jgi:hypothetical protein
MLCMLLVIVKHFNIGYIESILYLYSPHHPHSFVDFGAICQVVCYICYNFYTTLQLRLCRHTVVVSEMYSIFYKLYRNCTEC